LPEKEGKMQDTIMTRKSLGMWFRKRGMLLGLLACAGLALVCFVYTLIAVDAKDRDKVMMRDAAPLAINFALRNFSQLDVNQDGNITGEELDTARNRPWPNEDVATSKACLGYLKAYQSMIGHEDEKFPTGGGAPPRPTIISREDLNSWLGKLDHVQ
jgi:hypothetical protein